MGLGSTTDDEGDGSQIGAAGRKRGLIGAGEPETVADVEAAVELAKAEDGPTKDKVGARGLGPTNKFNLNFVDRRKRLWAGEFEHHVLSVREKVQVGLTRARMANGLTPEQLDATTANLLEIVAYLSVALSGRPDWAKDLLAVHDETVLVAIYEEVAKYEGRFLGAITD